MHHPRPAIQHESPTPAACTETSRLRSSCPSPHLTRPSPTPRNRSGGRNCLGDDRADGRRAERLGDRHPVVAVADRVVVADLDHRDRRQRRAAVEGEPDALPAAAGERGRPELSSNESNLFSQRKTGLLGGRDPPAVRPSRTSVRSPAGPTAAWSSGTRCAGLRSGRYRYQFRFKLAFRLPQAAHLATPARLGHDSQDDDR